MDRPAAAITADGAARHSAATPPPPDTSPAGCAGAPLNSEAAAAPAHVPPPRANIPQW
jgi:hypothetical protein